MTKVMILLHPNASIISFTDFFISYWGKEFADRCLPQSNAVARGLCKLRRYGPSQFLYLSALLFYQITQSIPASLGNNITGTWVCNASAICTRYGCAEDLKISSRISKRSRPTQTPATVSRRPVPGLSGYRIVIISYLSVIMHEPVTLSICELFCLVPRFAALAFNHVTFRIVQGASQTRINGTRPFNSFLVRGLIYPIHTSDFLQRHPS